MLAVVPMNSDFDLSAPGLLHSRTYRWLQSRIIGLLTIDSRLYRHFKPPEPPKGTPPRRR